MIKLNMAEFKAKVDIEATKVGKPYLNWSLSMTFIQIKFVNRGKSFGIICLIFLLVRKRNKRSNRSITNQSYLKKLVVSRLR